MFQLCSAVSGEVLKEVQAEDFHGKAVHALKSFLTSVVGYSRFRQRLFLDNGSELCNDHLLLFEPQKLQIVFLHYCQADVEQERLFFAACAENDVAEVERHLLRPGNPNVTNHKGWTALHIAAVNGNCQCVNLLVEARAELDLGAGEGSFSPLHLAAEHGHVEAVRLLIDAGAQKDKGRQDGATALYFAAQNGHVEVTSLLLEVGANKNCLRTDIGATPLYS